MSADFFEYVMIDAFARSRRNDAGADERFVRKVSEAVTQTPEIARSCVYWRSNDDGVLLPYPSVRLAEIAVVHRGDIVTNAHVSYRDAKTVRARAWALDLATNVRVQEEVVRLLVGATGKPLPLDEQQAIEDSARSVAFRSAVFRLITGDLIRPIVDAVAEQYGPVQVDGQVDGIDANAGPTNQPTKEAKPKAKEAK